MISGFVGIVLFFYVLVSGFLGYVCLCADPETSAMAKYFTETLPASIVGIVRRLLGAKVAVTLSTLSEIFLVLVYLFVILGGWTIMFWFGFPWMRESMHVNSNHTYAGYVVFVACLASWRAASRKSPGYITFNTISKYDNYPYDELVFVSNNICPTVGIRKLARSKYDRWSRHHVSRFDHFCAWLDNPIGEENYRYFLLFLLVHVAMCLYGSYVVGALFWGEIQDKNLMHAVFINMETGEEVEVGWAIVSHFLFARNQCLGGLFILLAAMGFVLSMFFSFHLYLTARGMTTNEYYKWKMVKKWHKMELTKYNKYLKEGGSEIDLGTTVSATNAKNPPNKINTTTTSKAAVNNDIQNDNVDVGCTGPTTADVKQNDSSESKKETEDEDSFDDDIMNPGPKPINIYDNGIIENFKEVLFPRSLRSDALDRWKIDSLQRRQQNSKAKPNNDKKKGGEQKEKAS